MIYFVKSIQKYGSAINYNIIYNKIAYKYFLKVFYEQINKKKYESQILKYN